MHNGFIKELVCVINIEREERKERKFITPCTEFTDTSIIDAACHMFYNLSLHFVPYMFHFRFDTPICQEKQGPRTHL